jgi:hypothetical protein
MDDWLLVLVIAGALAAAVALAVAYRLAPRVRATLRVVRCPFHDRDVAVEFSETFPECRRVDVRRCSLFSPPSDIACHKRCLDVDELPLPGTGRGGRADR